ncbi:MAG: acetyl-CoA carboxylase biotin carboxylase subunit [Chlorobi bacterium]|nr:acetyl-CoA carboxylase biotin carboxylase subunit [Chlorobiota bacterium]MCI0715604.1 acetyl-CoA carboxylase biotin carboxylase subunit [Chlorobiota bacterium]
MFDKILIANRGEIALRIIRTCREMGIKTVAVYSEADRESLHVRFADEAVCIGPAPSRESYLNIPRLIAAAEITNVDAIHPGYGFLAENAGFSEICNDSGIKFIGPSPEMINSMGDKAFAKDTMKKAGVPVVPGSDGVIKTVSEAIDIAREFGYPVLIKAVAGGGGKGMRIVRSDDEMQNNFDMAANEALNAFGNGDVYIEKFVEEPRHIEIQVLGDQYGNVVHLGERDCTIQRRHQKLIEETPSPFINDEVRDAMGAAAVTGAKSVKYEGAGTVEFIVDKNKNFYFMEMNTRIQVEHPVTEQVTGVDLIREQICIASGQKLKVRKVKREGHSIECRINAENPDKNFAPSPGNITSFHMPGGLGIRVDTHAYANYVIPPYYDSMIAKLIVTADDREEAIKRMYRALDEFIIEGIHTTIPFHKKVMHHEKFVEGNYDTSFIEKYELA